MRAGIARVALKAKLTGKPEVDFVGKPLVYANEMAERHSLTTIGRWADGMDAKAGNKPSQIWCKPCRDAGREAWQPAPHACDVS